MSHYFGLKPWDVERLTYDEIAWYQDAAADLNRALRKAGSR